MTQPDARPVRVQAINATADMMGYTDIIIEALVRSGHSLDEAYEAITEVIRDVTSERLLKWSAECLAGGSHDPDDR